MVAFYQWWYRTVSGSDEAWCHGPLVCEVDNPGILPGEILDGLIDGICHAWVLIKATCWRIIRDNTPGDIINRLSGTPVGTDL